MKKKLLLSFATALIGGSTIFGFSSPASAFDVSAGPILNNDDAKVKCPAAVASQGAGATWNGQWTTIVSGRNSVCGADVKAGPILNNDDAKVKCPAAVASLGATWNGQWHTTVAGQESVCGAVKPLWNVSGPPNIIGVPH